jgi:membrane protease YdiL (CAAX protease family)
MFASLHLPSAVYDYGWAPPVLLRFFQTALAGFMLGCVYWWTGSVLTTIALHGLRNFVLLSLILRLSGVTVAELRAIRMPLQLLWLVGEMGFTLLICWALFGRSLAVAQRHRGRSLGGLQRQMPGDRERR